MKRRILLVSFFVLILSGCSKSDTGERLDVTTGMIDMTDWNPAHDNPVDLSGEWAFYWHQLVGPDELKTTGEPEMIEVPGVWNGHVFDGEPLPGTGYATYQLSVKMDDSDGRLLSLYVPTVHTSYNLWVNGKIVATNGLVGTDADHASPRYKPNIVTFEARKMNSILLQVSNFSHSKGGIGKDLVLGTPEQLLDMKQDKVALNMFVFGSLIIMAFYHIGLFLRRPKDKSSLYFGLLCFMGVLRTITVDQMYLIEWFPHFSWLIALKMEYISMYFGSFLYLSFIRSLFPLEMNRVIYYILSTVSLSFSLIILCFPARTFTLSLTPFEFFFVFLLLYIQFVLILASIRKRPNALISDAIGFLFLGCAINDILYYAGVLNTNDLVPIGFFFLIVAQSFNLSLRFAHTFRRIEEMSSYLEGVNETLEEQVRKRTKDLEQAQFETAATLAEKSILLERSRIARELHDILGHMLTSTSVQIEVAKKVVSKDVQLAIEKMDLSQQLIQKGLDDIRGTVHTLKGNNEPILFIPSLHKLIEMTEKTTGVEVEAYIDEKVNSLPSEIEKVVYHTLQEGLTNGIRHGQCTNFKFKLYLDSEHNLHFYLSDDGCGTDEIQEGFGLTSIRERIEQVNGSVVFTSKKDDGFIIDYSIPFD